MPRPAMTIGAHQLDAAHLSSPATSYVESSIINCSVIQTVCKMISWSLQPLISWLWLFLLFELCCGQGVSSLDPEGFAQRAALPGVFVISCK